MLVKSWLGVSESDLMGGKLVVAVHNGIDLVVHDLFVQWVEEDLGVFLSLHGNSGGFSGDVGWVDLSKKRLKISSKELNLSRLF